MKCLNCKRTLNNCPDAPERGRIWFEDEENGTIGCDAHPAAEVFEEQEEVPPHVPDTMPEPEEWRAALAFCAPLPEPMDPNEPEAFDAYTVAVLADLRARVWAAR